MLAAAAVIAVIALIWYAHAQAGAAPSRFAETPFSYGADWGAQAGCGGGRVPDAAPAPAGVSAPIAWGARNEIGAYGANVISLGEAEAARLSPAQRDLAPEPTVRDGTVAPPSRKSVPNMVRAGLGARSAAVAAYRELGDLPALPAPDLGLGRLVWARAAADRQPPPPRVEKSTWRGAPMQGALVPLGAADNAADWSPAAMAAPPALAGRPMSLPRWHLEAAGAAGAADPLDAPDVPNPADFVTDGPFGAAAAFANARRA